MEKLTQEMIDATFATYTKGKTIEGKIIRIDDKGVLVNIGGKRDAFIYNEDLERKENLRQGDNITGIIIESKDENGYVKLSNLDYIAQVESKKVASSLDIGKKIKFKVQQVVKGGIAGKIADYNVFVPLSQIDFAHKKNINLLINTMIEVYIIQMDLRAKKLVCSLKKVYDEIKEINENNFWSEISENQIIKGKVKRFAEFGVFVEIENSGVDGLLHNSNVGYLGEEAKNTFNKDEEYNFIILSVDRENRKIELGYKQLQDDPRIELLKKYNVGDELTGKIIKVLPFGLVVELEKRVSGFLHISQAEYGLNDMRDAYKLGEEIECKIIDIDLDNFKISLSRLFKYDYEVL
ncbi:MAG: S1 RNA-binding domain-containing protein [Clostridia bacterium]|nr:S1 RNA-binding domain-containing protein [Clostridia bacterium]